MVADVQPLLPPDVTLKVTSDDAVFVQGALDEVVLTLILSTLIVIAVIFAFLMDLRATLIPAIALPVALIGTFAAVWLAGFSINILMLLALVLATGMVVDDAIVVLENIVRRRSEGMGARAAAVLGTQQVFFAVVTTTATLAAVFVPLSFLGGQAGALFREFGFTLAMAVLLSSVVALTLCPVLASRLLKDQGQKANGPFLRLGAALRTGAADLQAGANQAATAGRALSNGSVKLNAGVNQATDGFKQLGNGLRTLDSKRPPNSELNRLKAGADALASGHTDLSKGMDELQVGSHKLLEGAMGFKTEADDSLLLPTRVKDGVGQLAGGLNQLDDGIRTAADAQKNQARVDGLKLFRAQAPALHGTGAKVLDEHI